MCTEIKGDPDLNACVQQMSEGGGVIQSFLSVLKDVLKCKVSLADVLCAVYSSL